jgi:cell division protein FtsN
MANYDRANHDHDDRDYDGGPDDDDNEGSHLPVVIIIAVIVLAAFGGVVWLAYNQGVARGRSDAPVRVATATTKGDDSGIKVYQQSAGPEEDKPAVTAPAPAPQPQAAAPEEEAPPPAQAQTVLQPPTVVPPPPRIGQPAPKPQPVPPQQQVAAAKPYSLPATDEPANATKPPAQLGGAHPAAIPPAAAPKPAAAAPKPVTPPPAPAKPAVAASGSYLLQVGAFKSDAEARTAWKAYQSKHATLLNGFGPDVQKVDLGEKGTWYRLRIASFSDKDAAAALCERLKAQGGSCFLAK